MTIAGLLFLHVLGVCVLAAATGIELVTLGRIGLAKTTEDVRAALAGGAILPKLFPIATVALFATGAALTVAEGLDPRTPWLAASLLLVVAAALVGPLVVGRRMGALAGAAFSAPGGTIGARLDAARRDTLLQIGRTFTTLAAVALLALMSMKPGLAAAVTIVAAVVVTSMLAGLLPGRKTAPERTAIV